MVLDIWIGRNWFKCKITRKLDRW